MTKAQHQAARRSAARARGDCGICCRRPAKPGRFRCVECTSNKRAVDQRNYEPAPLPESRALHAAKLRQLAQERGKCTRCLVAPVEPSRSCCASCLAGMRETSKGPRRKIYRLRRAAGLCTECEAPSDKWACRACRMARAQKNSNYELRLGEGVAA